MCCSSSSSGPESLDHRGHGVIRARLGSPNKRRNVTGDLADAGIAAKFLVRERDTHYVASFDEVFEPEGTEILKTPDETPNADAFAERFVGTVRSECFDHLFLENEPISNVSAMLRLSLQRPSPPSGALSRDPSTGEN